MKEVREQQQQQGMYRPEFEHDNCGIGKPTILLQMH